MAVVLVRPTDDAPIQAHLNHFLRFTVEEAPNVGTHHQLLIESLRYLLSWALKPLYKVRIEAALQLKYQTTDRELVRLSNFRFNRNCVFIYKCVGPTNDLEAVASQNHQIVVMRQFSTYEKKEYENRPSFFKSIWLYFI